MAYPAFSQVGVTTFTFSSGFVAGEPVTRELRQVIRRSENGADSVYTLSPPRIIYSVAFQDMTSSDFTALLAFLSDPLVNYSETEFTYTDHAAVAHTVQLSQESIVVTANASGTYDGRMQLSERTI